LAPSEPLSRPRRWWWFLALAAILAGSYFGWQHFATKQGAGAALPPKSITGATAPVPVPVTVATAERAEFPVNLNGLGTVQPFNTVTVRSRVDGQIIKVAFQQGRMVKQGDVLVQVDPRPYQAALTQAESKKAQDEANLKNAKLNLDRYQSLANKDFASKQQVDTQQAMVDQLTAQISGDQAAIENAQTQLSYTTITAPLSGRAGFRLVDLGNIVHASDQNGIVTIVQLQPISVVFTAPEEDVQLINKALEDGVVPVKALSSDGLKVLAEGRLGRVDNQVDQASGTIRLKGVFDNKDNILWPGLSVQTRLLVDTLKQVVVIPEDAVQHGPDSLFAFVIGDDNKASVQPITVSQTGEGKAVVQHGLDAGQRVVVAGQYRLQAGTVVKPNERPAAISQAKSAGSALATEAENISPKVQ
jgi:multidrug efflux system membrane fusion protein